MPDRLADRFAALRQRRRGGLVTFLTAGDPDPETSLQLLRGLPGAGADVIEIGMAFSDPLADGPVIQEASLRARRAGMTLRGTLELVRRCRDDGDNDTPIILMGYYNPIHRYGVTDFVADAAAAGVDGVLVVDLPPEEDGALWREANAAGLHVIRLATPTSDAARLPVLLARSSGFLYYVAVAGITGAQTAPEAEVAAAIERLRPHTELPICVGFGLKTAEAVAATAKVADGAVVGTAIVKKIADNLDDHGKAKAGLVDDVLGFVAHLASGLTPR